MKPGLSDYGSQTQLNSHSSRLMISAIAFAYGALPKSAFPIGRYSAYDQYVLTEVTLTIDKNTFLLQPVTIKSQILNQELIVFCFVCLIRVKFALLLFSDLLRCEWFLVIQSLSTRVLSNSLPNKHPLRPMCLSVWSDILFLIVPA